MADYHLVPVDHNPFDPALAMPETSLAERYKFERSPQFQGRSDALGYASDAGMPEPDLRRQFVPRDAFEAAALRQGASVRGGAYDPSSTPATQAQRQHDVVHAAGLGASYLNPLAGAGMLAGNELLQGNPEDAPLAAAGALIPYGLGKYPQAAAAGVGGYLGMTPTATGGGLIDSLPENERAMYADQLKQAQRIRDPDQRRTAVSGVNVMITERVKALRDEERRLANDHAAAAEWLTNNADSIKSLPETQRGQIHGANPADRPGLLRDLLKQKEEAGKTFAERHAPEFEAVRAGSAALGVGFPAWQHARQVGSLERATSEAQRAYAAASKGRLTNAARNDLALRTNVLRENLNIPSGPSEFAKELGYGSLLPYTAATFAPNALEAMGRFATGKPEDREVAMRALGNLADPWSIGVSGGEGLLATLLGQHLGRNLKNADVAQANARGLLGTLTAAADKKAAALEKAAATRAANRAASQQSGVVSEGSLGAATAPSAISRPRGRGKKSPKAADDENGAPAGNETFRAAINPRMYNPPATNIRSFEADYPKGALADEQGRLLADVGGQPLNPDARWIVGRRVLGGEDHGFPHSGSEYDALATALIRGPAQVVEPRLLPKKGGKPVLGVTDTAPGSVHPTGIRLNSELSPEGMTQIYGHEIGHVHDQIAGEISSKNLMGELKTVYNDLNNQYLAAERKFNPKADAKSKPLFSGWTPESNGYHAWEVEREYIAEAIRAYMRDPTYMKNVAPKTAAAIRAAINRNPYLSKHIQFNSLAPLGIGLGAGAAGVLNQGSLGAATAPAQ